MDTWELAIKRMQIDENTTKRLWYLNSGHLS